MSSNAAYIEPPPVETTLWTDRYRPKKFVDLLGDEVRIQLKAETDD